MPILALLQPALAAVWSFATSRLGQLILAAAVAYGVGHHRASQACADREAAERAALAAAHQVELAREAEAAREIAAAATQRAEEDAAAASAQQRIIDRLKLETAHVAAPAQPDHCAIDDSFARRVRDFDAADRAPAPARRAR